MNSLLSLFAGLVVVYFFIWFFRVGHGRWKLFLLSLPFVKIIYDFVRGVPEGSILFSGVDPFTLPPRHQMLSIGMGVDGWTPYFNTSFSVRGVNGQSYNSSVGDYLLLWIYRCFGSEVPLIIVSFVVAVSATLLSIRIVQYIRFEKARRQDRLQAQSLNRFQLGPRSVDIYKSSGFSGTPFTGGIIRPYICLPEDAMQKLMPLEQEAVIAHEMGHVRYFDLPVTILIQAIGDLFWFVPGYRWLSRKIDRLREIVADGWAVAAGIQPVFLAGALLKIKDIPDSHDRFVLYSAFFREKSLLRERVDRLLGQITEKSPRFGWQNRWFRYVVTAFISAVVLNSVIGGNFASRSVNAPAWLENLLNQ